MNSIGNDREMHAQAPVARQLMYVVFGTLAVLSVPLIAMQFTSEVDWGILDFAVMAVLLASIGSIYVFASRMFHSRSHRIILGLGLGIVLFLFWAELAVGVFGSPLAGS